MAFRIGPFVIRGEIDNTRRSLVTGTIWLQGCTNPVKLELKGNCLRDIAGTRFTFQCSPSEAIADPDDLKAVQAGRVGEMTASRKVNTWQIPVEQAYMMKKDGKEVPVVKANCLYLEWFSKSNGRVVLETVDFRITAMTDKSWQMTAEEELEQAKENMAAFSEFMENVEQAFEAQRSEWSPEDDRKMDEFEWEKELRESDKRTDKYCKLIDKYEGHPDAEKIVAREMGWDWLDNALDADERKLLNKDDTADLDYPPLEADPATEGIDWIRTSDGDIRHPLAHRAAQVSISMARECRARGFTDDCRDDDVSNMTFQAHMLSAKLAGALNSLGYKDDPDGGFVVASLKRALKFFDTTMAAAENVTRRKLLDAELTGRFRQDMFEIREEILRLMKKYRNV